MKIAICDDEQKYIEQLIGLLNQHATSNNLAIEIFSCNNSTSFLNADLESFDLVFLDVKIGACSGIALAQALREKNQSAVLIFVSAFVEYAIMGYSVNASEYLLKSDLDGTFNNCMLSIKHKLMPENKTFNVLVNNHQVRLPIENILYAESFKRLLVLHTNIEAIPHIEYYAKLSEIEQQLATYGFLRIQKSFLINMRHCVKINTHVAYMRNGDKLSCSRQKYSAIIDTFLQWKGAE